MASDDHLSESERSKAVIRAYMAAHEAKDKAALMSFITEETRFEMPFNEGGKVGDQDFRKFSGLAALSKLFDGVVAAFAPDDHIHMHDIEMTEGNGGSTIFVECTGGGRMSNGRTYQNRYVMRYDIRDGKILRLREYYNPIATAYAFDRLLAGRFTVTSLD
jgi:ketosteroid isomerase-like protein